MARVAMFVLNDCRTDARVLREAATLAAAGHSVTIVARTTAPYAAAPEREVRGGVEILRVPVVAGPLRWVLLLRQPGQFLRALRAAAGTAARRPPAGWLAIGAFSLACVAVAPVALGLAVAAAVGILVLRVAPAARPGWLAVQWRLQWRFGVTPWTALAVSAAPRADICHAHDLRALPAAIGAASATGALIVYDSHEIFVEAGLNAERPARARAALRRVERTLAASAAALVTVNDGLAAILAPALGMEGRTVVVRNCPARWEPPSSASDALRAAAGVSGDVPLVLCHGAFVRERGFEQLAAALTLPPLAGVHAVFLGRGPLEPHLRQLAADPALDGRIHVLAAVPPEELPTWIHGADVVAMPIQPSTLNHRLSTPNKLFEALGAGVPVVASDFPAMRAIVVDDPEGPLGEVCDPASPSALALAIRSLLDLDEEARAGLRARCLAAAHARYAWEIDAARLLDLYDRLAASAGTAHG